MQGQSLRSLLAGDGSFSERPLFWEHEGNAAIRVGDRKLVRIGINDDWELFDLKSDRTEQVDLAAKFPDEVAALAKQWREWAHASNVVPRPAALKKRK